jgi:hypothetical protein
MLPLLHNHLIEEVEAMEELEEEGVVVEEE